MVVGARRPTQAAQRFLAPRTGGQHMGADYPPPTPGQVGSSIYSIAAGTVLRTGRGNGAGSSVTLGWHSGYAVIIDHGTVDGKRLYSYYGHLHTIRVSKGQAVQPGTRIGDMGGSGANTMSDFAPHLHAGIFVNNAWPTGASTTNGYINPETWFASKGIVAGTTPPVVPGGSTPVWPAVDLPITNAHTTASHNAWVKLMADIGYTDASLSKNLQSWLKAKNYYTGQVDGNFGPMSIRALQTLLTDRTFYSGQIDGSRGPMTVQAEIRFLNDQRRFY
ncbi:peptidoglycan DD-metalloendopeptidase family protein [Propionibacteriaceae bacterium Y1923]